MTQLTDNIIDTYRRHPKTGPSCETPEFKELSRRFHEVARQVFALAIMRGDMKHTKPMPNFWQKWEEAQM